MPPGKEEEEEEKRGVVDCMLGRLWATVCQQKEALALADVLRGAACGGSKWQGLSVGLIVRKRR